MAGCLDSLLALACAQRDNIAKRLNAGDAIASSKCGLTELGTKMDEVLKEANAQTKDLHSAVSKLVKVGLLLLLVCI